MLGEGIPGIGEITLLGVKSAPGMTTGAAREWSPKRAATRKIILGEYMAMMRHNYVWFEECGYDPTSGNAVGIESSLEVKD